MNKKIIVTILVLAAVIVVLIFVKLFANGNLLSGIINPLSKYDNNYVKEVNEGKITIKKKDGEYKVHTNIECLNDKECMKELDAIMKDIHRYQK